MVECQFDHAMTPGHRSAANIVCLCRCRCVCVCDCVRMHVCILMYVCMYEQWRICKTRLISSKRAHFRSVHRSVCHSMITHCKAKSTGVKIKRNITNSTQSFETCTMAHKHQISESFVTCCTQSSISTRLCRQSSQVAVNIM